MMENELYHYGVLGMKWGHRKSKTGDSSSSASSRKTKKKKRTTIEDLSDEELKKKVNRLDLEKRYKDLTSNDKKVSEGRKLCQDMLKKSVRKVVQPELDKLLKQGMDKVKDAASRKIKGRRKSVADYINFSDFYNGSFSYPGAATKATKAAANQVVTALALLPKSVM